MEERQQIAAIDGRKCEKKWIDSGRDPGWLTGFLKMYPAAFYLSWVKDEIAKWGARGDFDNLKLIQPGPWKEKKETRMQKLLIDFLIYQAVTEMLKQGKILTGNKQVGNKGGIFEELQSKKFIDRFLSGSQIRTRYYRFIEHQAAFFIDDGKKMIFGPGRIEFFGMNFIGFGEFTPDHGFNLITPE